MNKRQITTHAYELENAINMLKRTGFGIKDNAELKHSEKGFLWLLSSTNNGNPIMPSDIAKKINVTLAAVTHHINSLEKKGYVIRTESKDDRRVSFVSLSKKGIRLILDTKEKHHDEMQNLTEYLGEKDSKHLIALITKINEYLEKNKE